MIEVIYEKEKEKAEGNQAFFRIPNNIRQIGEIQGNQKIYIEDYAYTYLCRIASEDSAKGRAAILLGQANWKDGKTYLFIKSAVALHDIEVSEEHFAFTKDVWKQIYEENKKFFPNQEIVGWFLSLPGCSMELHEGISKTHFNHFGGNEKVLMVMEPLEKEEAFYRYEEGKLTRQEGFYVYYEKNAAMQSYMITARKKIGVTPSEVVEDKAAKDFRNLVKERFEAQEQKKTSRLTYVASVFLVIVVLIMGVTTLNNYGKMKSVQSSLEFIRNSIMKQGEEKTQKTSGTVKEANEQQNENTVQSEQTNDPQTEEQQDPMPQQGEGSDSASTEEEKVDDSSMSTMQEMSEDIYIVEKGDTLAKISKKVYGDSGHVDAICRMNGLSDGNLIFIGQKLILP